MQPTPPAPNRTPRPSPFRAAGLLRTVCLIAVMLLGAAGPTLPTHAASLIGYRDFYFGSGASPTVSKPESKLWWNDGSWWGNLLEPNSGDWHIFRLNWDTQVWQDTGTQTDGRSGSRSDVLWDQPSQKLYIATRHSSDPARLHRFSYNAAAGAYSLDAGFPVTIGNTPSSTIVLEKDSTGQLWITYAASGKIWVNRSTGDDASWGTPFVLPVGSAATVEAAEDISSVIKFNGDRIGVFWGNQRDYKFYFAVHLDSAADDAWTLEVADDTPRVADNHINLKSLLSDGTGKVYAAVKTSINNQGNGAPLIELLVRQLDGAWSASVFSTYGDDHTVPMVLLDEENGVVYMFAVQPGGSTGGGTVYMKSSPLGNIQFSPGLGTPFIQSSQDNKIHNPTSTKQNLNGTTNLLVLAADKVTNFYLHNVIDLPGGGPAGDTPTPAPTATNPPANTPTRTPTPTATSAPNDTPTPTPTSISPLADPIFADGFESGNFSAWSSEVDGENDLNVTAAAALGGSGGMAALIDNRTGMYVRDLTPAGETRYRARFYFDPNGIAMAGGDNHRIMTARSSSPDVVRIEFRRTKSGTYQLRATTRSDSGSYLATGWFTISDAPHAVEFDWMAATGAGANDGYLSLWIDGDLKRTVGGVDSDTLRVEEARLGPQTSIDSGTLGTEYFDDFVSRRETYIGP